MKRTMKVTAEIKRLFDEDNIKAAVSLTIEGVFVIRGVRLVEGKNGLFVSMPSRKNAAGEFYDICFPINNDTRLQIFNAVTAAYEKTLKEQVEGFDDGDIGGESKTA